MDNKLLKLEALRGFAAIYVVLHHTIKFKYVVLGLNLGELFRFGQEAVILFFLLSGFVINYSFSKSTDRSFKNYFFKRFFRIYIPLLMVFCIGYLNESLILGEWVSLNIQKFLMNMAMLQGWSFAKPNVLVDALLNNTPLWSLSYEWWFYMLFFPVAVYIKSKKVSHWIVFSTAVVSTAIYVGYPYFIQSILSYFAIWWAGVFLAELYASGKPINFRTCLPPLLSLSLICGILAVNVALESRNGVPMILGKHPLIELRHFAFALFCLIGALLWKRVNWVLFDTIFMPFAVFAPISYVIYISHYHLITSAEYFNGIGNPIIRYFAYLAVLLLFSWFVELKAYPWLRRKGYRAVGM